MCRREGEFGEGNYLNDTYLDLVSWRPLFGNLVGEVLLMEMDNERKNNLR